MKFVYDEKLKEYMERTGKEYILVEVVTADTSDVEVSEIAVRFIDRKMADVYTGRKHFKAVQGDVGFVLVPPFRINYAETVQLSLFSLLFIHLIRQKGMRL